jgi:hypothetical protein
VLWAMLGVIIHPAAHDNRDDEVEDYEPFDGGHENLSALAYQKEREKSIGKSNP